MSRALHIENCDTCGRFVSMGAPGASWSQQWRHEMDGSPSLEDPVYRCSPCTDRLGIAPTNCAPSYPARGRNAPAPTSTAPEVSHD